LLNRQDGGNESAIEGKEGRRGGRATKTKKNKRKGFGIDSRGKASQTLVKGREPNRQRFGAL